MLKIRWAQAYAIAPAWRASFEQTLVARVEKRYPEKIWNVPQEALREEMTGVVDQCLGWGLERPKDIIAFVDIVYDARGKLDLSAPSITSILSHTQLDAPTKLRLLLRRIGESLG